MCGGMRGHGLISSLFLGLWLAGACEVRGQTGAWGPRIGVNLSGVLYADGGAQNGMVPKMGVHLGAAAALAIDRHVSVEAAAVLSQDGFRGEGSQPGDLRMDYLDVPLVAKLRLPNRVSPHLLAGFTVGYMVRCRLTRVAIVGNTTCDDRLVGTHWRALDIGALGGIGMGLPTGKGRLELDLLLHWGLRDLKEDLLPPGAAKRVALRLSATLLSALGDRS